LASGGSQAAVPAEVGAVKQNTAERGRDRGFGFFFGRKGEAEPWVDEKVEKSRAVKSISMLINVCAGRERLCLEHLKQGAERMLRGLKPVKWTIKKKGLQPETQKGPAAQARSEKFVQNFKKGRASPKPDADKNLGRRVKSEFRRTWSGMVRGGFCRMTLQEKGEKKSEKSMIS